jgi:hypothetical protein
MEETQQPAGDRSYGVTAAEEAQLGIRFVYHPPKADQPPRYEKIRDEARALARTIMSKCPDSRERSLALTKLEEAVMWANAAIARNE